MERGHIYRENKHEKRGQIQKRYIHGVGTNQDRRYIGKGDK